MKTPLKSYIVLITSYKMQKRMTYERNRAKRDNYIKKRERKYKIYYQLRTIINSLERNVNHLYINIVTNISRTNLFNKKQISPLKQEFSKYPIKNYVMVTVVGSRHNDPSSNSE